jgi:predicted Co/Zn/Cd cation transporter (cation efflux family)
MPDSKGYSRIGAALTHLIDSMNQANAWKDHSAELVEVAAAFRRIAEPLGPEGVEKAIKDHVKAECADERATYAKIGTTLMVNVQFILRRADPLEDSGKVAEFASILESIAAPLGPKGVEKAIKAWDPMS